MTQVNTDIRTAAISEIKVTQAVITKAVDKMKNGREILKAAQLRRTAIFHIAFNALPKADRKQLADDFEGVTNENTRRVTNALANKRFAIGLERLGKSGAQLPTTPEAMLALYDEVAIKSWQEVRNFGGDPVELSEWVNNAADELMDMFGDEQEIGNDALAGTVQSGSDQADSLRTKLIKVLVQFDPDSKKTED